MTLILASSSPIRRHMLDAAGVEYHAMSPDLDEASIKAQFKSPEEIAGKLAETKALGVGVRYPDDWVVGSDSVVSIAGRIFDKPSSRGVAAKHLRLFSGQTMTLTSAVALVRGGEVDWLHVDSAALQVRLLSDAFIDDYLDAEWPEVGYCVGVFRLEGRGVQLFSAIDGNFFTILGMPLIPLLGALRDRSLLPS